MNVFDDVVRDIDGVIVAGANVYIYASDGSLANLFEADGTTPKANPLTSDDKGQVKAWLADGYYTAEYFWGGRKRFVRANVLVGTAPIDTAVAAAEAAAADAVDAVGAVRQTVKFALQPDAGLVAGAWYGEFFVDTTTAFTLLRHHIYLGTGTAVIYINVNDVNVDGPFTAGTGAASNAVSLTVAAGSRVSFQLTNLTGAPGAIAIQLEGLPA